MRVSFAFFRSAEGGITAGRWRAALAGCVLVACAPIAFVAAVLAPQQARLDGEYGLNVRLADDSVVVHWITTVAGPGRLLVRRGAAVDSFQTVAASAHRVAFRRPRADSIQLEYGSAAPGRGALASTTIVLAAPRRPAVTYAAADSLFIVGDTHGAFDELVHGLTRAGLIDAQLHWIGGRKQLAFAGDLTDRGPDVTPLLWFVYRLEREAARAGGRVHVLLGNHETMVMLGDLRYVHPKEQSLALQHGTGYHRLFDPRYSVLGRWLASKPALIRIGRVLITHGGVVPEFAALGLTGFDQTLAKYVAEDLFYNWSDTTATTQIDSASYRLREDFFWHPRSVFWHRAYVQNATDSTITTELTSVLRQLRADVLVVGHTAVPEITGLHGGKLIAAHTPRHGGELLLLVNDRSGLQRYRITARGTEQF